MNRALSIWGATGPRRWSCPESGPGCARPRWHSWRARRRIASSGCASCGALLTKPCASPVPSVRDALARQRVARHLPRQPPAARHLVQRQCSSRASSCAWRSGRCSSRPPAAARVRQRNAQPGQQRGIAHARQLQQLRRLHRAQAQQRLAARAHHVLAAVPAAIGQADAAPALEQQPRDARAALDCQVAGLRPVSGSRPPRSSVAPVLQHSSPRLPDCRRCNRD